MTYQEDISDDDSEDSFFPNEDLDVIEDSEDDEDFNRKKKSKSVVKRVKLSKSVTSTKSASECNKEKTTKDEENDEVMFTGMSGKPMQTQASIPLPSYLLKKRINDDGTFTTQNNGLSLEKKARLLSGWD